jgi:hypothetical protein
MRARGELVEIRAGNLRFTVEEAAAYLNEAMGLELTVRKASALEACTEGWVAALQLDDRYIVDYLTQEVLQRQPEEVRSFSCWRPPSPPGSAVRCATRSPAARAAELCWRPSSGTTRSSFRSTTVVAGTAVTTCSPTCRTRTCWTSGPMTSRSCTGG